jgi:hypothetical protein
MQLAMVEAADGNRVFVADLSSERAGLREAQMMRFSRRAAAYDARLSHYEFAVLAIAKGDGLGHEAAESARGFPPVASAKTSTPFAHLECGLAAGATWTASVGPS